MTENEDWLANKIHMISKEWEYNSGQLQESRDHETNAEAKHVGTCYHNEPKAPAAMAHDS